jgi:hypothetical protein
MRRIPRFGKLRVEQGRNTFWFLLGTTFHSSAPIARKSLRRDAHHFLPIPRLVRRQIKYCPNFSSTPDYIVVVSSVGRDNLLHQAVP